MEERVTDRLWWGKGMKRATKVVGHEEEMGGELTSKACVYWESVLPLAVWWETRETKELNGAEGRIQRCTELSLKGELVETGMKTTKTHPEQEVFVL